MNYHKLSKYDTANGLGVGLVVWCSGCSHHCKGCHNPETWDEHSGREFTDETLQEILTEISHPYVTRVTLSGGDPLFPANRDTVKSIVQTVKSYRPDIKIWLYTGYTFESLIDLRWLSQVDVIVDGEFVEGLKDISLPFCGSLNQRLIDAPRSFLTGKTVCFRGLID